MGEEEKKKKPEEKKVEAVEEKKEDGPGKDDKVDEKKDGGGEKKATDSGGGGGEEEKKKDDPPPPPPEELIMRVYMHCEGCARKVQRSLRGFEGVEDVKTDCRTHKVVVKGKVAAADPLKVVERVEKKTGRKVELLTPIPPKPEKAEEKKVEEEPESKPDEAKEQPKVISVLLKVNMHCEACSQEIKKRILKMKGVEAVEPMLKSSEVLVKGVFDPPKAVEYIYKRTGKHAVVMKVDPDPDAKGKENGEDGKADEKKGGGDGEGGGDGGKKEAGGGGKDGKGGVVNDEAMAAAAAMKMVEMKRNEYYYHYPRYAVEHAYPPQIFSDENPNACSVM